MWGQTLAPEPTHRSALMRRAVLLLLGFAVGAASLLAHFEIPRVPRDAPCVAASPECHEPLKVAGQLTVGVYRTFALTTPNPAITRAVVVVHGSKRNNDHYFKAVADSAI